MYTNEQLQPKLNPELREIAKVLNIQGASKMKKQDLIDAILNANTDQNSVDENTENQIDVEMQEETAHPGNDYVKSDGTRISEITSGYCQVLESDIAQPEFEVTSTTDETQTKHEIGTIDQATIGFDLYKVLTTKRHNKKKQRRINVISKTGNVTIGSCSIERHWITFKIEGQSDVKIPRSFNIEAYMNWSASLLKLNDKLAVVI